MQGGCCPGDSTNLAEESQEDHGPAGCCPRS
jgi:hypothetical protein